jgi:sulfatase modifying factor 1
MKKLSISFIILLISYAVLFSANDKLYEIDGRIVDIHNKTNGPKALVKLSYGTEKNNSDLEQVYSIRDSFQISLKDSIYWLEMEKNTDYTICIEEANEGLWKGNDFSYKKEQNCILLNSGNYVKNGKIWYVTKFGNVFTFNILVGMKYIDLSTQEHLLGGYSGNNKDRKRLEPTIMAYKPSDPVRFEMINEVLVVDKYKVTECEFIQSLWDSIPASKGQYISFQQEY